VLEVTLLDPPSKTLSETTLQNRERRGEGAHKKKKKPNRGIVKGLRSLGDIYLLRLSKP